MATPGQVLENPITGERIVFRQTAGETGGERLVIDHFLKPHTGTFPEHIQLNQEERFEILSGTATCLVNGSKKVAGPGEVILVPPGTPHRNPWNESDRELVFRHQTSPDFGSEVFFESIFSLAEDGKTNRKGEVGALQILVIGNALQSQTYVTGPPIAVQKVMNPILAALGRRLGYPVRYSSRKFVRMSAKEADLESAKAAIQALNQQWEINFENHDAAGLAALFTEDCVRMPQGGPATVGRSALEAAYRQDFAEVWKTQAKVRLRAEEVIISGEYAFARGTDTLVQDREGRQVAGGETGKWLFIYRRQPDGAWKYHWTTFNSNE